MNATGCWGFSSFVGVTVGAYVFFGFAIVEVFCDLAVVLLPDGDDFFGVLPEV